MHRSAHRSTSGQLALNLVGILTLVGVVCAVPSGARAGTWVSYGGSYLSGWDGGAVPAGNVVASRTTTIHTSLSTSFTAMIATQGSFSDTGVASVTGASPATLKLPAANAAAGLSLVTTTMDPTPPPCCAFFSGTTSLVLGAGTLSPGGGDGSFVFTAPGGIGKVVQTQTLGSPKFGGTLKMIGLFNTKIGFFAGPGVYAGTIPQPWEPGSFGTNMATATFVHSVLNITSPLTITVTNFKWTTGMITVTDMGGAATSFRTRTGYDLRNGAGTSGTLQVVAPMLAHGAGFIPVETAMDNILRFTFVPEPGAGLMLGLGIVGVLMLEVHRRRSR